LFGADASLIDVPLHQGLIDAQPLGRLRHADQIPQRYRAHVFHGIAPAIFVNIASSATLAPQRRFPVTHTLLIIAAIVWHAWFVRRTFQRRDTVIVDEVSS
jgi:hypothetical protein